MEQKTGNYKWEEICKEKRIKIQHFRKLDKVITPQHLPQLIGALRLSKEKPTETWKNGKLYATLIADRNPDGVGEVSFGMCVVNPKDTGSIEKGRKIAYERYKLAKAGRNGNFRICNVLGLALISLYGTLPISVLLAKIKNIKSMT